MRLWEGEGAQAGSRARSAVKHAHQPPIFAYLTSQIPLDFNTSVCSLRTDLSLHRYHRIYSDNPLTTIPPSLARMTDRRQNLAAFTTNLPATSRLRAVQPAQIFCSKIGRDFSVKMDIASIPKVDSVSLMGLDFSMRPEKVRYEVHQGFISAAPEHFAMHTIKSIAIMVYQQERFTPMQVP